MGISVLSAVAMVVIDIAFFAIIALFALLGFAKGIAKSFSGVFSFLAIVLIALILMGLTIAPVSNIGAVSKLEESLAGKASTWGDMFNEPVYSDEDGNYYIYDGAKLSEYGGVKGKFANFLANKFMTPETEGNSLADIAAGMLTTVIIAAILFVVYIVALGALKFGIKSATKGLHTSEFGLVKLFDRILGTVVSAALALIFILVVLAIFRSINVATINDFIRDSSICSYFYDNNPISQLFSRIFGA